MEIKIPEIGPQDTVLLCVVWNDMYEAEVWGLYMIHEGKAKPKEPIQEFKGLAKYHTTENGFNFYFVYITPRGDKLTIDDIDIEPISDNLTTELREYFYGNILHLVWSYFV